VRFQLDGRLARVDEGSGRGRRGRGVGACGAARRNPWTETWKVHPRAEAEAVASPPPPPPAALAHPRMMLAALLVSMAASPAAALPDLVTEAFDVSIERGARVDPGDVIEGCAGGASGRTLLRFSLRTRNVGESDLVLGDPGCPDCAQNPGAACADPLYVCAPAHGHAHFESYARAELVADDGMVVASGRKFGFCILDVECGTPQFTCSYQGLSAGCADVYLRDLPCQYMDLTGIALGPGDYRLRITVDPDGRIPESDETNNSAEVPLAFDCDTARDLVPACSANPFLCYGAPVHGRLGSRLTVDITGSLGAFPVTVRQPRAICTPASAGTDARADDGTYLAIYAARPGTRDGGPEAATGLRIVTQLGETSLDVKRLDGYAAPASLDPTTAPSAPVARLHTVDRFACVTVKVPRAARAATRPMSLPVGDRFTDSATSLTLKKPRRLCSPVDTAAGATRIPTRHLLCYDVAKTPGPRGRKAYVADEIGARTVDLGRPHELCLLAERDPPRPVAEDLQPCTGHVDVWRFDGRAGRTAEVRIDTTAAATAADLCVALTCGGLQVVGDDERACSFAPPANQCPTAAGIPASDAACVVTVRSCGPCASPDRADYVLRASVAGEDAHPTLLGDDEVGP
jgi:hypothetical protein